MSVKHRSYFEGAVQSLELFTTDGRATVGVIEPGRFRFSSDEQEHIRVIAGTMRVRLADASDWRECGPGELCVIPAQAQFDVEAGAHVAYLCEYRPAGTVRE